MPLNKAIFSFFKSMTNMLNMFQAMAIWAKNLEIRNIIIISISIFMMNAKYAQILIITTSVTFFNQLTTNHHFSNCCKRWFESFFGFFIYTRFRTIFSFANIRGRSKKFLEAMMTFETNTSFSKLRFVITFSRAIFCLITSGRNMRKLYATN
jgi:hypothetical protein